MAERVLLPDPDDEDGFYDADLLLPERKPRKLPKLTRRARLAPVSPRRRKVNVSGMLTETEYVALKRLVFARAGHRCERCGEYRHLDAHHRKLVSQGGPDAAVNLAALCRACHDWCHRWPLKAQAAGWIVPSFADPASRAMLLWNGRLVLLGEDGSYSFQAGM